MNNLQPVGFQDVQVGDRLQFVTSDNGFNGAGQVWRDGTVLRKTAKTITVGCESNLLGSVARLNASSWHYRAVRRYTD